MELLLKVYLHFVGLKEKSYIANFQFAFQRSLFQKNSWTNVGCQKTECNMHCVTLFCLFCLKFFKEKLQMIKKLLMGTRTEPFCFLLTCKRCVLHGWGQVFSKYLLFKNFFCLHLHVKEFSDQQLLDQEGTKWCRKTMLVLVLLLLFVGTVEPVYRTTKFAFCSRI